MDKEKLLAIKETEEQAKLLINEGEKDATNLLQEANEKGRNLLEKSKKDVQVEVNDLIKNYETEGQAEASKILSVLDSEKDKITSLVKDHKKDAISFILQQMKVKYVNR